MFQPLRTRFKLSDLTEDQHKYLLVSVNTEDAFSNETNDEDSDEFDLGNAAIENLRFRCDP